MLLLINLTGLSKTYWIPSFKNDKSGRLWYVVMKFLFVEISIYSKELGVEFIKKISNEETWSIK